MPEVAEEHVDLTAPAASGTQEDPDEVVEGGAAGEVIVDVAGKVKRPGIVVLPAGARVHEAIEAAGGLDGTVDTTSLNLARELSDGEQVLVGVEPAPSSPGASGSPGSGGSGGGSLVNLNAASLEELQSLPGVGPVTAQS
ncbi:SLBB domain-containing protein, partial [Xanthomonas euvesicatoria]|uniref:SLBB domain-containing protein n=1 Tax=Xanthomonas euvesicatoria TaxID=456327 RepID=UPI0019CFECC8